VTVELYQLPKEFAFQSLDDLVKFEAYLAAVGLPGFERGSVPLEYAPIETIENKAPELVGVYYQLYFSEISKKSLQAKVTAKETLEWECDSHNWPLLEAQFPELAQKFGTPFECLESLESKKRNLIDSFARMQIVEAHPEWVNDSLFESDMQEKEIYLTRAAALPFKGISDLPSFQRALENQDELIGYTQDNEYFYRFLVQSKGKQKQVLSFKEALAHEGLLDKLAGELGAEALAKEFVAACGIEDQEKACLHRLSEFLSLYKEEAPEGALAKQFKIRKNIQTITRSDESFIQVDKALNLEEGAFSQVDADAAIGPFVYQFMERKVDTTVPTDKLIQSQELLSSEARCRYFETLLAQF
jgi:hypothetical protein